MDVKEITDKNTWQQFIDSREPNSFLHSWFWGELEESQGRKIFRFGAYKEGKLIAVMLLNKVIAKRGTFLACPHGPIISSATSSGKETEEILKAFRDAVVPIAKKEKCDFIRISTLTLNTEENKKAFKNIGFRNAPIHLYSELDWILDITVSEEELLKNMKKNTRYSIRKAEKDGVTVRQSTSLEDFETFWTIYMATVSRQHFTPFSKDFLKKEFEIFFRENQAVLFFAEYKGEAISTAFVVYANGSGFYHHGASNNTFPGITPSELVQWEAIKEAKKRGLKRYNFWGVVPETATKHPWHGLSKFKRSFGGYAEEYVRAEDYVLTSKYWFTYIVERVRKYKRGL